MNAAKCGRSIPGLAKGMVTIYGEGGGGATKREGGQVKFYRYKKRGGAEKV